eukprot:CAMPEP_0172931204 /NCGR_PEP_ID=MMETSP1075-20121228/219377_1 /TAXON_ID=2916 /ORGANISM="Ceratium fusus, Strain PA161109" /LENGTH=768 /DNA_ID=CAMNT_0013792523 /DNA_START=72 /DNA_END=2380 /DNA_ORIENTATION=+
MAASLGLELRQELEREWLELRSNIDDVLQAQRQRQLHLLSTCLDRINAANLEQAEAAKEDQTNGDDFAGTGGLGVARVEQWPQTATVMKAPNGHEHKDVDDRNQGWNRSTNPSVSVNSAEKKAFKSNSLSCASLVARSSNSAINGKLERCLQWHASLVEPPRTGRLAQFVDSSWFEFVTSAVILANSAFMVYTTNFDVDNISIDPTPLIVWTEFFFTAFYFVELYLRVVVHRFFFFFGTNLHWNWFDLLLVIFGIVGQILTFAALAGSSGANLTFMRAMRILKLAKISRTVRLMHQFSELRLILKSLMGSLANLGWSTLFLFLWNESALELFDLLLVIFGIVGQSLTFAASSGGSGTNLTFMRAMRILKLAKISRAVRLMHQFSELRLILKSLMGSLTNLGWSLAMLALVFYLFALVFVQLTAGELTNVFDEDPALVQQAKDKMQAFSSVQVAMLTLFMACSGGEDWSVFYTDISEVGWAGALLFVFFVAFMQIAVMNILTGIFAEHGSLANLGWSLAMLALIFYLFALVFVQLTAAQLADVFGEDPALVPKAKEEMQAFSSVQDAMLTLYMSCSGGEDWLVFYTDIREVGWAGALLFVFFVAFMQIAVMNILTGIFVEQAMKLARPDRDQLAYKQRRAEIAEAAELRKMIRDMDKDGDGTIKRSELCEYIDDGKLKAFLKTLGLDLKNADLFFHIIDAAKDEIDIETFVRECMNLRGTASNFDLAYLINHMREIEKRQQDFHVETMDTLRRSSGDPDATPVVGCLRV